MMSDINPLNSNSQIILDEQKIKQFQSRMKLILLALSALEINHNNINVNISKNQQELEQNFLELVDLLQQNQELIRRACSLLEQMNQHHESIDYYGVVKDYLHKFKQNYKRELASPATLSSEDTEKLALKLLPDLLFYSGKNGDRLLWEQLHR